MVMIQSETAGEPGLAQLEPTDGERLRALFYRLSAQSIYRRFMTPIARPEQIPARRLLDVDHRDREAIVATLDGEIIGVARYVRARDFDRAEVAVVVADAWQRQGLATRLLTALAERAKSAGISRFTLTVQADNTGALSLLRRFRPDARLSLSQGVYEGSMAVVGK
jgi:RimJ/RimL family protein N-acetyltransferase